MTTTIIHKIDTGDRCSWRVEEEINPSNKKPFWSVGVTHNGCLRYVGDSITADDILQGQTFRQSDLIDMRREAIRMALRIVRDAGYSYE